MTQNDKLYTAVGTLQLKFNGSWGILDGESILSSNQLKLRRIPQLEYSNLKLKNKIWIPGSVFKGNLRHTAIKLVNNDSSNICIVTNTAELCSDQDNSCLICSIFGGKNTPGKIYFSSVIKEDEPNTTTQSHILVDRSSKSIDPERGGLFTEERITSSTLIDIQVQITDVTHRERNLIHSALKIWGKFGLGKGHKTFSTKGIEALEFKEVTPLL